MLQGKTAIITGSTSGIGQGMAYALAESGCNIMLNGLGDAAQIEADRAKMEKETGVKVLYNGADMTKPDQIAAMMKETKEKFGKIDIIVNNAGVQHVAPIDEFPPEKWDQIIAINLTSAFHMTRLAVPYMKEQGWGRIINLASAHALVASPFKAAYVAAKHGIAGLTKTVALELGEKNITCNAICPGYVKTPLVEKQIADQAKTRGIPEDEVISKVILAVEATKKFTTVEDIGALAVLLCSDAGKNITGAVIPIDGGWTAS
ncbi:MAG: 3-hydroxybutyrate dehydrogenase [Micavibrio aeruginosavorus]|uniref:3-hydroxybutyrate dehydrogenase n=1 Tax=Micavibrio aeruginosavorus TaxID=349221 RepID=A0A2W5PX55_9BACT|nr:MAG: 3-hydroxybutyrate dehydrogenase [Micavibrio aeruginosavorus]